MSVNRPSDGRAWLLVVEDAAELRAPVVAGLRRAGYRVDEAADGRAGHRMAADAPYDLIVLDRMLPGLDGLELLRRLRGAGSSVRVLMLTARDAIADRVAGLAAGADDYLIKPFAFDELVARVEALMRRETATRADRLSLGPIELDLDARVARRADDGRELPLTRREFALLALLARRRGRVLSREEIERHVYDPVADGPMSNVVDSAICALRRKLEAAGAAGLIRTRRGEGYQLPRAGDVEPDGDA